MEGGLTTFEMTNASQKVTFDAKIFKNASKQLLGQTTNISLSILKEVKHEISKPLSILFNNPLTHVKFHWIGNMLM